MRGEKIITFDFCSKNKSKSILGKNDEFFARLTRFDMKVRSGRSGVGTSDFIRFVQNQAMGWTTEVKSKMESCIKGYRAAVKDYIYLLPRRVNLVLTSGREEGGMAYCRGMSTIVIPSGKMQETEECIVKTLIHESFHILSRNNPRLRDSLYKSLGFNKSKEIHLPQDTRNLKITNPDAPRLDTYFGGVVRGVNLHLYPVLLARSPEDPAKLTNVANYLKFYCGDEVEDTKIPKLENQFLDLNDVTNFFDMVGLNTRHIIHPEEIFADNFVLLVSQDRNRINAPQIIDSLRTILIKEKNENGRFDRMGGE